MESADPNQPKPEPNPADPTVVTPASQGSGRIDERGAAGILGLLGGGLEGQVLGEFEILSRLGQGGMGAVYKARQISLKRLVALKTLQGSLAADREFIARFQREAIAAAALNHPNLVQVYSAGETDGLHWFAMEFVEGESAQSRLKRKERLDGAEAVAIAIHVATALEYGWRKAQLIHRDIKPDNIFLSSDGEVKLGDLGLAKSVGGATGEAASLTATGSSMGTPHYISPEQGQASRDVDFRADIYSLGCTLYHLVSGKPPFSGDSAMAVMLKHVTAPVPSLAHALPGCPPALSAAVMRMMAKDPAYRQQNYAELLADLRRAYDAITTATVPQALPVTQQQQPPPPPKRPAAPAPRPAAKAVPAAAPADIHSTPTVIAPAAGNSGSKAPHSKSRAALIAAVVLLLGIAAFFAFRKKEPQLTEAERAAKEGGTRAPSRVSSAAGDGSVRGAPAPPAATKDAPFVNSLGMKFVPVPGTKVLFSIWHTRVMDFEKFAAAKPGVDGSWKTQAKDGVPVGREADHPVVGVTWEEAQAFCAWLTEKERKEPGRPRPGNETRGEGAPAPWVYRLPTDAEWSTAVGLPPEQGATPEEKSERGKDDANFPWGTAWPPTTKVGNYADESFHLKFPPSKNDKSGRIENSQWLNGYDDGFPTTSPVGSFSANAHGLHDMGGNVWQWCEDWWNAQQRDRILRGGAWDNSARDGLRATYRAHNSITHRHNDGFRCVLEPAPSETASVTPAAATKDAPFVNTLGMKFVPVPITGGPTDRQRVLFSVWATRVQDYEVMVSESGLKWDKPPFPLGPTHPAVLVSWEDAQGFCTWLTARERKAGTIGANERYRLPTDHEWSNAAGIADREDASKPPVEKNGKIADVYPWGAAWPPPAGAGNFGGEETAGNEVDKNYQKPLIGYRDQFVYTAPVGSFAPNALGLHDIGGNAWNWCEDLFEPGKTIRVLRGGSWAEHNPIDLLSSFRNRDQPGTRYFHYGFRVVLAPAAGK